MYLCSSFFGDIVFSNIERTRDKLIHVENINEIKVYTHMGMRQSCAAGPSRGQVNLTRSWCNGAVLCRTSSSRRLLSPLSYGYFSNTQTTGDRAFQGTKTPSPMRYLQSKLSTCCVKWHRLYIWRCLRVVDASLSPYLLSFRFCHFAGTVNTLGIRDAFHVKLHNL